MAMEKIENNTQKLLEITKELFKKISPFYDERANRHDQYEAFPIAPIPEIGLDEWIFSKLSSFFKNHPYYTEVKTLDGFKIYTYDVFSVEESKTWKKYDEISAPTWLLSVLNLIERLKLLGSGPVVDIGAHDGRFPCVAKCKGLDGLGIEINPNLIRAQEEVAKTTETKLKVYQADGKKFDYANLDVSKPTFVIIGFSFTDDILKRIYATSLDIIDESLFLVLDEPKYLEKPKGYSWENIQSVKLPNYWFPYGHTTYSIARLRRKSIV